MAYDKLVFGQSAAIPEGGLYTLRGGISNPNNLSYGDVSFSSSWAKSANIHKIGTATTFNADYLFDDLGYIPFVIFNRIDNAGWVYSDEVSGVRLPGNGGTKYYGMRNAITAQIKSDRVRFLSAARFPDKEYKSSGVVDLNPEKIYRNAENHSPLKIWYAVLKLKAFN